MTSNWAQIVAGASAGITTSIVTCPLDVVKVRIQGQVPAASPRTDWRRMGMFRSLRHILRTEGLRGWYHGLGTTMLTYIPTMTIYFPTYTAAKTFYSARLGADIYSPRVHVLAAMTAGGVNNVLIQPMWLVRTRLMTQTNHGTPLQVARAVVREEGLRALYKGMGSSMLGFFHIVIQFPLYERLKLVQRRDLLGHNTAAQIVLASIVSKVCATLLTYPHEVIRTRLQLQTTGVPKYRGIMDAVRTILREEGWRGMYGGLQITLVRVIPNSAITFLTYEMVLQLMHKEPH